MEDDVFGGLTSRATDWLSLSLFYSISQKLLPSEAHRIYILKNNFLARSEEKEIIIRISVRYTPSITV